MCEIKQVGVRSRIETGDDRGIVLKREAREGRRRYLCNPEV